VAVPATGTELEEWVYQIREFLTATVAEALGLGPASPQEGWDRVVRATGEQRAVLVLDGFEQPAPATAQLDELLAACPNVRPVVTSRVRLAVARERVLPLALELAAAWARVMPLDEIASKLGRGLELLVNDAPDLPERHRSIHAAFDRSGKRLRRPERDALASLAVFERGLDRRDSAAGQPDLVDPAEGLHATYFLTRLAERPGAYRRGLAPVMAADLLETTSRTSWQPGVGPSARPGVTCWRPPWSRSGGSSTCVAGTGSASSS
jgi:predicted ATPase